MLSGGEMTMVSAARIHVYEQSALVELKRQPIPACARHIHFQGGQQPQAPHVLDGGVALTQTP